MYDVVYDVVYVELVYYTHKKSQLNLIRSYFCFPKQKDTRRIKCKKKEVIRFL